ncbi:MAG: molecular chaperone DnaJ [Alphaproteobacteria bacterium]|nr:MAG: molecular chaperone DnaJ [Alphaproteobacteria bacterium]
MAKNPLEFEFDIRVSSDKKRRARGRRGFSGAVETSQRVCEHPGCNEPGKYRAPKSPDHLDEYLWFCLQHVREYNNRWNFFEGTTDAEFEALVDKDRVWGRPTRPFSARPGEETRAWSRLGIDDPMQVLGERATRNPGKTVGHTRRLPPKERKALEILEARDTWTKAEIRKQYKSLVKDLHPDMNGGNRADEERLQEVVWAWDQIKDSRNFAG